MTTFYPSYLVRLQIRLEEGAATQRLVNALEASQVDGPSVQDSVATTEAGRDAQVEKLDQELKTLAKRRSTMSLDEYETRRARLSAQRLNVQNGGGDLVATRPGALTATDPDDLVVIGDISPISVRINRNGLNQADTFSITIDYKDAPFDARAIRACFVEITAGLVPADQYALGIQGFEVDGALTSQIARGDDSNTLKRTKVFGFVDDWGASFVDGDQLVLEGRSIDGVLMTLEVPELGGIDLNQPILDGVRDLIASFPSARGMEVVFGNPGESPKTDKGPIPADSVPRVRKARKGKVTKRTVQAEPKFLKLWDHLTEVVGSLGFVLIQRGLRLYIADPRTFLLGVGNPIQMVYGRNLSELKFNRKLGGTVKARTVEVRCYDPDVGKTRWARYPVARGARSSGIFPEEQPTQSRASEITPAGLSSDPVLIFRVKGFSDQASLERAAAGFFEQVARQEIEGSFETEDVTSFGGVEGDLLDLQPGDAVEILVASADSTPQGQSGTTTSNLQELQAQSIARRTDYLRSLGWTTELAKKVAVVTQQWADTASVFRVAEVQLDWSLEDGIKVEVGFINFLIAREEANAAPELPAGGAASALAKGATAGAQKALLEASSRQQTLGQSKMAGNSTEREFVEQGAQADADTRTAAISARRGQ